MKLEPNWTISDLGPWQLIYNDVAIISLAPASGVTSTQGNLYVGTQEECESERIRLGLPWATEPTDESAVILPEPDMLLTSDIGTI